MAFTEKKIDCQFELANGQFEGGGNTATISGVRISCHILNTGAAQGNMAIAIFGLPLSLMNQLSTVGTQYNKMYENGISVSAGDDESGMSVVWTGAIASAYVDLQQQPNGCFRVISTPGAFHAIKPVKPVSIKGSADAAGMMKALAGQMGFTFENNGVTAKLSNPYYAGTAWTQALAIAHDAGFDMVIQGKTMAIVPASQTRQGDTPLISPDTGLMNYPTFNQVNVVVRALFNPAVKVAGEIEVKSQLSPANGKWKVLKIEYDLEAQTPDGRWDMTIEGIQIGLTTP